MTWTTWWLRLVGDVDAEVVERLARHYIGTFPAGDADTYVDRHRPFPEGVTRRDIPVGPEMSAVLEISYEADVPVTPSARVNAHVLRVILDERLFQQVREELGGSYVASVSIVPALTPRPKAYSDIVVTVDAAGLDDAHATVLSILADLVANSHRTHAGGTPTGGSRGGGRLRQGNQRLSAQRALRTVSTPPMTTC